VNQLLGRIERDDFLEQIKDYHLLETDLCHKLGNRKSYLKVQKYINLHIVIPVRLK
jgi:hypothetical protein